LIRLGLQLPVFVYPGLPDSQLFARIVEVATVAESSGFDGFFLMDHVQQIGGVGRPEDPMLEPYTLLGAVAARTSRLTLGTLVTSVVYRNPALLAKMVTTLDIISGGRAILGIGAGWYEDEATRYDYPWPPAGERLARLEDALQICRAMFTQERATVTGRHHAIRDALNNPRPLKPGGPKILVGGGGERRTLRLAAQYADACNIFDAFEVVRRKLAILTEHCREVGRDPAEITRTRLAMLVIAPTTSEADQRLHDLVSGMPSPLPKEQLARMVIAGDPDAVCRQVQAHLDAGIDGLIFSLPGGATSDEVELAGRTLAPRFGSRG
jgi:F420-dependent oxidoreductase-like protein